MNLDDAKEMIAKYLVGFPIDKELLSEACKVASEDDDYIRLFRDVPGLDETMGECENQEGASKPANDPRSGI